MTPAMSVGSGRYRMLVVDDQEENLDFLARVFRDDFEVSRASTPTEALALLGEAPYAVIISDQVMPDMSGIELLERSIALAPEAVRILITGFPEVGEAVRADPSAARAFRFFSKPLDGQELHEAVQLALRALELERENRRLGDELASKSALLEGLLAEKEGLVEARVQMRTHKLESELSRLRTRDVRDGTGAWNQRAFRERLTEELLRARRFAEPLSLLLLGVPLLPAIQLEQGRERADHLGRTVVEMLRLGSRCYDAIGRLDLDRFAVIMPRCDARGALARLARLRQVLARTPIGPLEDVVADGRLGMAAACVSFGGELRTAEALLEAAERALEIELPEVGRPQDGILAPR